MKWLLRRKWSETMYQYKSLDKISLSEISQCMNLAFSDYAVPIHLTEAELSNLFWVSGVDRDLSYGAFFMEH